MRGPRVSFACCSWWPGVEMGEGRDGGRAEDAPPPDAASDVRQRRASRRRSVASTGGDTVQNLRGRRLEPRWTDAGGALRALSGAAVAAARSVDGASVRTDGADPADVTPAAAAARALALIAEASDEANANAPSGGSETMMDAVWITAGVSVASVASDDPDERGGSCPTSDAVDAGASDADWPAEAVAAYGVLRAARDAGARVSVLVLPPPSAGPSRGGGEEKGGGRFNAGVGGVDLGRARVIPSVISAVASRLGASVSCRFLSREPRHVVDPGVRWRGSLVVPVMPQGRADANGEANGDPLDEVCRGGASGVEATRVSLPGLCLSLSLSTGSASHNKGAAREEEEESVRPAAASASSGAILRAGGDMLLLEVVRLEAIPPSHVSSLAPLRLVAEDHHGDVHHDQSGRRVRDGVLAAMAAASRALPPARAPALLVRIAFAAPTVGPTNGAHRLGAAGSLGLGGKSAASFASLGWVPPPPPHAGGPTLLVYADGEGGFVAALLASLPTLLRRAIACVEGEETFSLGQNGGPSEAAEKADETLCAETPEETDPEARERALMSVAMMQVQPSLSAAAAIAIGAAASRDGGGARPDQPRPFRATDTRTSSRRRSPRLSRDKISSSPSPSSVGAKRGRLSGEAAGEFEGEGGRGESESSARVVGLSGSYGASPTPPPRFALVLDALVRQQEADDAVNLGEPRDPPETNDPEKDHPPLTGVLLRAAADVEAGRDVVRSATRAAAAAGSGSGGAGDLSDEVFPMISSELGVDAGGNPNPLALALEGSDGRSRSRSRSRTNEGLMEPMEHPVGATPRRPMDWAAAEAALQERCQRERQDRRERAKMHMAPCHLPKQRRTGNSILAAAKEKASAAGGAGGGGGRPGGRGSARGVALALAAGAGSEVGSLGGRGDGAGQPMRRRHAAEPSESGVGGADVGPCAPEAAAGVQGARGAGGRVCPGCRAELAPIPGVNMNNCYVCGSAL